MRPYAASDFERVLELYAAVGWTAYTRDPELLRRALDGSSTVLVEVSAADVVGLARVVSDGATICYLQDLLVHPSFHRRGIGRRLVEAVLEPYAHVRQKVLLTDQEPGQQAFYVSLGYRAVEDESLRAFVRPD